MRAVKQPIPYWDMSDQMLRSCINKAEENIKTLFESGHPRAAWSITVLRENIRVMKRVMGEFE